MLDLESNAACRLSRPVPRKDFATLATVLAALSMASPAFAAPISQFSSANISFFADDGSGGVSQFFPETDLSGALVSNTETLNNGAGTATGFASASLADAALRAAVGIDYSGLAGTSIQASAFARMGDGFRASTAGGTPFTWTSGSTARFTFDVSGLVTGTPDFSGSYLALFLYQPGTLQTNASGVPFAALDSSRLGQYLWTLGPESGNQFLGGFAESGAVPIESIATANYTSFPTTINLDFAPGGDFDWFLVLAAGGGLNDDTGGAVSFDADFANTVRVSYTSPEGAVTSSQSGLFTAIDVRPPTSVPEPGTLALLGIGLAGLASTRRRRAVVVGLR